MAETKERPGAAAREEPVDLRATAEALAALKQALAGAPPGKGVRVWVDTGIHPEVRMMFDAPSPRDLRLTLDGVPVYVDSLSRRFLEGAEIQVARAGGVTGFHLVGPNVPARAEPPPPAAPEGVPLDRAAVEERVRRSLKQIYDPEIPMNLVDLGLIYGFDWESDQSVTIRLTLTSIGCPSTEQICEEVERIARESSGLPEVHVNLVWDPPWSPDRMSAFAQRQFGYL